MRYLYARGRTGSVSRWTAALLAASLAACGLDKVTIPDEFEGPAELGVSLRLQAVPDVITADGFSTAAVQATLRDNNGQPLAGRDVIFAISDGEGNIADIGTLTTPSGVRLHAGTATARTATNGVAQIIYTAPARTDFTATSTILVNARPIGDDANAATSRTVRIELRSAEPRLFPQVPGNTAPTCSFIVEPAVGTLRVNQVISFQSTASDADGDAIIRYEWDFGDGTKDDKPDVGKVYRQAGTYTVIHVCTDVKGAQGAFTATLTVN